MLSGPRLANAKTPSFRSTRFISPKHWSGLPIQGKSMFELERQLLGYTHADIGERLLESWKVPESIAAPVGNHHDPGASGDFAPAACAIHVADAWVNTNRLGSTGSCYLLELDHDALASLGLNAEELHQIGLAAGQQTQEVLRQFLSH